MKAAVRIAGAVALAAVAIPIALGVGGLLTLLTVQALF